MRPTIPILLFALTAAACGDDPKRTDADLAKSPALKTPAEKTPAPDVVPDAPPSKPVETKPADPRPNVETPPAKPATEPPAPAPKLPDPVPPPGPEAPPLPKLPDPAPVPPVVPGPPPAPPPVPPVPEAPRVPTLPGADAPATWTDAYLGGEACKKCHFQEAKAWGKTTLAKSLDALRPTTADDAVRFDRKRKAGLDPAKDYSADATCLPCHVTGFGSEGGYPAPDSPAASDAPRTKRMGSISCEACHGPAARYVPFKLAALAADTNAKFDEKVLATYGLTRPTEAVCRMCHNEKSPTHAGDTFDWTNDRVKVHPKK